MIPENIPSLKLPSPYQKINPDIIKRPIPLCN